MVNYQYVSCLLLIIGIFYLDYFYSKYLSNITGNIYFKIIYLTLILFTQNKNIAVLLGITYLILLTINNSYTSKEGFNKMVNLDTENKYCHPKAKGKCEFPWRESINDKEWCCKGNDCSCVSTFPPTQCLPKNVDNNCPKGGMYESIDDKNMCTFQKNGKCKPDPTSPLPTTCSGEIPVEKPSCPCDPSLKCEKDNNNNGNKNNEDDIEVTPKIKVCSFIENDNTISETGKINSSKNSIFDIPF